MTKKWVQGLAVALALAGAVFFAMRRTGRGGREFSVDRAAELAPADATYFWVMPDLERTKGRWKESEVLPFVWHGADGQERDEMPGGYGVVAGLVVPDLDMFLVEPLVAASSERRSLPTALERMQTASLWIAEKDVREPRSKAVMGLRYRAKKSVVDEEIRWLKDQFFAALPGAKSELAREHGVEIETIHGVAQPLPSAWGTSPLPPAQFSLCIAFRDDWVFLATDRALLAGVLGRYVGAAGTGPSLAAAPWFAEGRRQAVPDADFCAWSRWGPEMLMRFGSASVFGRDPRPSSVTAVQYEGRVDGATHGRIYLQLKELPPFEPKSMAASIVSAYAEEWRTFTWPAPDQELTVPNVAFGERREPRAWLLHDKLWDAFGPRRPTLRGVEQGVAAELGERFGPELKLVGWDRGVHAWPNCTMAVEVDDLADAFRMDEAIRRAEYPPELEGEGRTLWNSPFCGQLPMHRRTVLAKSRVHFEFLPETGEGLGKGEAGWYVEAPGLLDSEVPGFFEYVTIGLPWLQLRYAPWLLPSPAKTAKDPLHPSGPIRVRKDGSNWVIDSDLNMLGLDFLQEMVGRRL